MDLTMLGRTGLQVSRVGLGTVRVGRTRGLKYPGAEVGAPMPLPGDERVGELLRTAAELGVNLIDTAPAYGVSEQRLGEVMGAHGWFGGRDRWVVGTKVGEEFDDATGVSRYDFTPEHAKMSVERSLRRLKIDTLDLVLVHSDGRDEWIITRAGTLEALRELKRRGLVRAMGISAKTIDGGLLAMRETGGGGGACDVVMAPYSPADPSHGVVIEAARLRGVGVLVKKALASGHTAEIVRRVPEEIRAATSDPVEAAMRFTLRRAGVGSVIVGTTSPEHLRGNVMAAERAVG